MPDPRPQAIRIWGDIPDMEAFEPEPVHVEPVEDIAVARRRKRLQELSIEYRNLPPLPPQLPVPLYATQDASDRNGDAWAWRGLFKACAGSNVVQVRKFLNETTPTAADLSFALEEACQNFQLDVVRFLLQQLDTQLHYRCFRRCIKYPEDDLVKDTDTGRIKWSNSVSQSIFTSGSPKLLDLLKIFTEFGWHPNQLLGPRQTGRRPPVFLPCQEVALHYPRCVLDIEILRFLLDAGADTTIAREVFAEGWFHLLEQPVTRLKADVLQMAVNFGSREAVALLLSHGADPNYGIPLHSLVRRRPDATTCQVMEEQLFKTLCKETPDLKYPTLSTETRLEMAQMLLDAGQDINKEANVFHLEGGWFNRPGFCHDATPLSHAKDCLDWDFVRFLLENGADPDANPQRDEYEKAAIIAEMKATSQEVEKYDEIVRQFRQPPTT